ncbi:ATP-binding protein [Streptomyces sp. NBC_00268]|uniref:ATP-binding protein n=1 Tax=Streptomyces sp. NBC_00268 TaxID=2975695 RepID=UPI002256FFDD|nr:ATP-binding protein [Streptomyces sp. NBC_00268]MCX5184243.1 ATP-binding protein [Streptomyces sp. NBC_00268]
MADRDGLYEAHFRISRHPRGVARSRSILRDAFACWNLDQEVTEAAELVLSELVTNALRVRVPHDRQVGVGFVYDPLAGLLRLEVSDAGAGCPELRSPSEDETCGRGLVLVEALADRWGVCGRESGIGKTVWATFKAPQTEFLAVRELGSPE